MIRRAQISALFLITTTMIGFGSAHASIVTLETYSSMDVRITSIKVDGMSVSTLTDAHLGLGGEIALYASTGRIGHIDPFTSTLGGGVATASAKLTINGIEIDMMPAPLLPVRELPSNSIRSLSVGDRLLSNTHGTASVFSAGDRATTASAPYFQVFAANRSTQTIEISADYFYDLGGRVLGSNSEANFGFGGNPSSASARKFNGVSYDDSVAERGEFHEITSSNADFEKEFQGTLTWRLDPHSDTIASWYNTHGASVEKDDVMEEIPEPSTMLIWILLFSPGLAVIWLGRRRASMNQ